MTATRQYLAIPARKPTPWQPTLHDWRPHLCSYPDYALASWHKWATIQPDWLSKKASSLNPDWFTRRMNHLRISDYKAMNYHYERPLKPTSRKHSNFVSVTREIMPKKTLEPMPPNRSFYGQALALKFPDSDMPAPNWGRYHPPHYEIPIRLNSLPPIKVGGHFHVARSPTNMI